MDADLPVLDAEGHRHTAGSGGIDHLVADFNNRRGESVLFEQREIEQAHDGDVGGQVVQRDALPGECGDGHRLEIQRQESAQPQRREKTVALSLDGGALEGELAVAKDLQIDRREHDIVLQERNRQRGRLYGEQQGIVRVVRCELQQPNVRFEFHASAKARQQTVDGQGYRAGR